MLSFTLKTILTLHLRKHLRLFPPDPAGPRKLIDATLAKQEKYSIETQVIVRDHKSRDTLFTGVVAVTCATFLFYTGSI